MSKFILITLVSFLNAVAFAQDKSKNSTTPTYGISGEAQILSHFLEKGISYSDGNPAMNASFLYNFGTQARIGFWGSNISNVNAQDDNFWFKILAEVLVDFSKTTNAKFFFSDNRFYKSNQRNGQIAGVRVDTKSYFYGFEWMSNLEGSDSNAEYFLLGRLYNFRKSMKYGGHIGYTSSHGNIQSFFDLKLLGQYIISDNSNAEIGITYNSNGSQFGKRGDPAYYIGLKLSY
ncbi:hypothetical protein [Pseudobdellovibrio exovorus]|uniref:Uncharacterized protein n=1 Tax=Pseudobdellovibrio exovorus JSS TaxID=1184267 RepID=M4VCP6_9BACT|nr:hypothetical protein [Pseudobdellovibrio exovorus]AGH96260.1 hypothetical protein A11Q_2044 [Pseudobdellovibrio exovorus JSS]